MKHRSKPNAITRARLAAQEEWMIEFFKNKFQVPYTKVREAVSRVGYSYNAVENYLAG